MSCCNNLKRRNYKSIERTFNSTEQPFIASGTTLNLLGTKATDTGCSIDTNVNNFTLNCNGTYHLCCDATVEPTGAGDLVLQIYKDGVPLPCAICTATVAAGDTYTLHTETDLFLKADDVLSFELSGVAGSATWVGASCVKWA